MHKDVHKTSIPMQYMIFFGIAMAGLFSYLTVQIMAHHPMKIDAYIQGMLVQPETSPIYVFFSYLTKAGSASGICILLAISICFFYTRDKDKLAIILLPVAVLMTHFLNIGVKALTKRERPFVNEAIDALGYSFPSGHAMISIVAYGLAAYLIVTKLHDETAKHIVMYGSIMFIFLIGISRIILSAHYPTDVIAGYLFGGAILYGCIRLYEKLHR
jgi:membrane-associated phospholipid phosphatase